MAEIVNIADHRPVPNPGNGAREALIDALQTHGFDLAIESDDMGADLLLAFLWLRGFKVVPLEPSDDIKSEQR